MRLHVVAEVHLLLLDRASAIALIVKKPVTNVRRHAFPGDHGGTVRITFCREAAGHVLAVSNDGGVR